jgi:hypothetical protein
MRLLILNFMYFLSISITLIHIENLIRNHKHPSENRIEFFSRVSSYTFMACLLCWSIVAMISTKLI